MSIKIISGLLQKIWKVILPLLKSLVVNILTDKTMLCLAEKYIEAATKLDLDGDGKYDWVVSQLNEESKALGKKYAKSALGLLVETVYQNLKSQDVI